jgi:predicted small secreted protein
MKKILLASALALSTLLVGCNDADIASQNLSTAADNFQINRRVVFYNGITGDYILSLEGLCSLGNYDKAGQLTVTCKTGPGDYKKHFLGLSDNVTYFAEQVEGAAVSAYHYKVIFKPQTIIPDVDLKVKVGG